MKLAVFTGQYFWFDGKNYSTDEAFVSFVTSFYPEFETIVFCDPVRAEKGTETYVLDPTYATVCPLPDFDTYSICHNLLIVYPKILRIIKQNIADWDLVWLPGPHPIALLFAYQCCKNDTPFFQVIRANLVEQVKHANRGVRRQLAVAVVTLLERMSQKLAQRHLTFTVGKEMFREYAKRNRKVYETRISLITEKDIDQTLRVKEFKLHEPIRLLSVGRLDPEKGLFYLIGAVELLINTDRLEVSLQIIGKGYKGFEERLLHEAVKRRKLSNRIRFTGYVPFGPELLEIYRNQDIFILPSLTGEGVPQTIFEAMACGTPIVATRVAGIPYAIRDGYNGRLVEPGSSKDLAGAVKELIQDGELRHRLSENGMATASRHTLDAEKERMMVHVRGLMRESSH